MAATTNDAQTPAEQAQTSGTTDPNAGELVTGKDAEKAVSDFLRDHIAPAGVSIARDNMGAWVVRKV